MVCWSVEISVVCGVLWFYFKSRLIYKKSKLKLYWSIIRPVMTCACETWDLKEIVKKQVNDI